MKRVAAIAVLQLPGSFALALILLLQTNTLSSNPSWTATKTTLARGVMGANHFVEGRKATQQNALDLGAWHGYQEVVLNRPVGSTTSRISFDVALADDAYLSFIFNKKESGFQGVRLSRNPRFANMLFTADGQGRFLSKTPFALSKPMIGATSHAIDLDFGGGELRLRVDRKLEGSFPATLETGTQIAFRGGFESAVIDNISIVDRDSKVFQEDFFESRGIALWSLVGFILLSLSSTVVAAVLGRKRPENGSDRTLLFTLITMHLVLAIMLALAVFAVYYLQGRAYPLAVDLEENETQWALSEARTLDRHIRRTYSPRPRPATYRILFVGSSQTWGAGAANLQDVVSEQVGRKLGARLAERGLAAEVINTGISALDSRRLIGRFYLQKWINLAPHLVVVNLSNNDASDTEDLTRNLEALILANRASGIETLLVKEARSTETETEEIAVNHARMQAVADRYGIPCIDMHRLVDDSYDDGFIWWDAIHLTSFGQTFVADRLVEVIWSEFFEDQTAEYPEPPRR